MRFLIPALALAVSGCQSTAPTAFLPEPPATFGQPVPAPPIKAGKGAKATLGAYAVALGTANGRLEDDAAFYGDVRRRWSGQ